MEPLYLLAGGLLVLYQLTLPPRQGEAAPPPGLQPADTNPSGWLSTLSSLVLYLAIFTGWGGLVRESLSLAPGAISDPALPYSETFQPALLFNALSSALLLGLALGAMILGHWYLVSRKLSFRPLKILTGLLCLAVLIRALASLYSMACQGDFWGDSLAGGPTNFLLGDGLFGLFVSCRFILGILLPGVLAVLAWRCARIRSNQSATGILYILVAFVLFGEILSKHFLANRGLGL